MRRIVAMAVGLLLWAGAAYAALAVADIPHDFGHGLCGPWGCAPALQALAAAHLFWAVLAVPPVVVACRYWPACKLRKIGAVLLAFGGAAVALVAAREAVNWLPYASESIRPYFGHRVLFAVVTLTDFPTLQLLAAGLACRVAARRTLDAAACAADACTTAP